MYQELIIAMKIDVVQIELNKKYVIEIESENSFVYGVETAAPIFINEIGKANIEKAAVLCLDSTNKVINYSVIAMGDIKSVKVSIPQILKIALLSNASKIIIAHNHPSGVLEITTQDIELTRKIANLAKAFKIELIDSIIVNDKSAISIREESVMINEK